MEWIETENSKYKTEEIAGWEFHPTSENRNIAELIISFYNGKQIKILAQEAFKLYEKLEDYKAGTETPRG